MIKIELYNNDIKKNEVFTVDFVSAMMMRKAMNLLKNISKIEEEIESLEKTSDRYEKEIERLDAIVHGASQMFNTEKVNYDSIMNGLKPDEVHDVCIGIIYSILNGEDLGK